MNNKIKFRGHVLKENPNGGLNSCKFTTQLDCQQDLQGQFHPDVLCSNPQLNTNCQPQSSVACVSGENGLYWFDSCGNQENIYSSDKVQSYNNGMVLSTSNSCSVGNSGNPVANQGNCGNCNVQEGSICGAGTSTQKLDDPLLPNAVCLDLSCVDSNGNTRQQGESWCGYQGSYGPGNATGGYLRATGTVGSRSFVQTCYDANITTEPCEDYQGEVCVQNNEMVNGQSLSVAKCKKNTGILPSVGCFSYNGANTTGHCSDNPDCFEKEVNVDSYFKLFVCEPKYPAGFDLSPTASSDSSNVASKTCSLGTQTCKVVYEEDPLGNWDCMANCNCQTTAFAEQMNDMCISLGDCGTKSNYMGEVTTNSYVLKNGVKMPDQFSPAYISALRNYSDDSLFKGKYIQAPLTNGSGGFSLAQDSGSILSSLANVYNTGEYSTVTGGEYSTVIGGEYSTVTGGDLTWTFFSLIFGWGDTKQDTYKFVCNPWQAPLGGSNCSECGSDGFPCSQYSCQSLGKDCQLFNTNMPNPLCISVSANDVTPPTISPESNLLPSGDSATQTSSGVDITASTSDGCIPDNDQIIPFGISVSEPAQCAISINSSTSFADMDQQLDSGLFLPNHSLSIPLSDYENLGLNQLNPNSRVNADLYVICQDANGNANSPAYDIHFCLAPGNDITPPVIISQTPSLTTVNYNTTSIPVSLYVDKPSDCSWSLNDESYYSMENNFTCLTDFSDEDILNGGWLCGANLPFIANSTTYYVRCLDQPWLAGINDSARNANTQSYPITFTRVSSPLSITSINIDGGNITSASSPVSVEADVTTSGGYDGTAECAYTWGNYTLNFIDTNASESTQTFSFYPGLISLPITCTDKVGDVATQTANFNVILDTTPPQITRIYVSAGNLNLETDKPSTCYYSNDNNLQCLFNINNASSFSGDSSKQHSIEFNPDNTYYVKCQDYLGNYAADCSAVIQEGYYDSQQL